MAGRALHRGNGLVAITWIVHVRIDLTDLRHDILGSRFSTMTFHAPTHIERCELIDLVHRLDVTVAGLTSHPFCNVALMRKVNKVWEFVDSNPLHRLASSIALADLLDVRAIGLYDRVTIHTDIERRHGSMLGFFNTRVTVSTRHLVLARMELVTKWNRLLRGVSLIGCRGVK